MPKTRLISAKGIVASIIRSTGNKIPQHLIDDILEYLPEGIGLIQVTNSMVVTSTGDQDCPGELLVKNHCACLPGGFQYVLAVEDECGRRIPEGGDITDFTRPTSLRHQGISNDNTRVSVFEVDPTTYQTSDGTPTTQPGTSIPLYGQDLRPVTDSSRRTSYYRISGNYIQTSFECGYIKLHYLTLPVDKEGYPLIPDNQYFKLALEWHIIKRLIGSGYEHKVFTYKEADEYFELYAARAMSEVSYPSLDSMARLHNSTVRLITPTNYEEDFYVASEQPEILRK